MAVGVASPAVGHAAVEIGGGDGAGGEATSEVAGKEEPPPAEGAPGMGVEGKRAAVPSEGVPAAIAVEGEEEDDEEKEGETAEAETEVEEEEEKWLKHYSSMYSILTVGDGDFSFSLSLASQLGSSAYIVATSLDTYEVLIGKYSKAESNIMELKNLETTVLHSVDVKTMKFHTALKNKRFDRIVFNFPHAGFRAPEDQVHMIKLHKELVRSFFHNACHLLMPYGEIHVSHKIGQPYDRWDLEHLASESSLIMLEKVVFQKADYPGYNQKRGDGARCDQPFKLGPCCTFKFRIGDLKKRKKLNINMAGPTSFLGGNNVHPGKLETDTRPLHLLPRVQAWPWLHFPSPVNAVRMPITLEPYFVSRRQQPGLPLNLDGIVRAPCFHQQGAALPMFSIPGPWPNALPAPGGTTPPMSRIACPNLLAPQEQPWSQHRTVAGPPGSDSYSYFEYQRCLQREYEVRRKAMMPGATGLNYSSAFLEDRRRESVQKQEWLHRINMQLAVKDRWR